MSATPAPERPPMRRPDDDRWLAGVCSAVARQLGVDPLVIRIATIALALAGGAGILLYALGLLLIPAEGETDALARKALDGEGRPLVLGIALVVFVVWAVADGWFFGFGFGHGWGFGPLVLGGVVVWLLMSRRERAEQAKTAGDEPPTAVAAEAPTLVAETRPRPRSSGRIALGVTLAGVAIVGAIGAIGGDGMRWDILLASAVIGLGAALVIAAPFGGARALIPLGLLLAAGTGVAAAADLQLRGGAGDRVYRPEVWTQVKSKYQLAAGRQEIDLRRLALPEGVTKVKVEQGFGEVLIRVPTRSTVTVNAHVSAGDVQVLGRESNGIDSKVDVDGVGRGPILEIDAHVGFGHIGIARGNARLSERDHRFGPGAITLGGALR